MTGPIHARLRRLQQQLAAFRKLHDDDLQLLVDELNGLVADLDAETNAAQAAPEAGTDPAAGSPKRAKWIAEQEAKSHPTRRDLLRGREDPA